MKKNFTFFRLVVITLSLFFSNKSFTQNLVPFGIRFDQDVKGDMTLIGNSILGVNNAPYDVLTGTAGHNASLNMQYFDIDTDASTYNSSSADLDIFTNNCYKILYAGLYWSASVRGTEPINQIKFKLPGGTYQDITGTVLYDANSTPIVDLFPYACYADVTSILNSLSSQNGTYTVANVSTAQGARSRGNCAGWSLYIVYEDPTLSRKSITTFDGFSAIGTSVTLDVPITGFRSRPAPVPVRANLAFAATEGDVTGTNDRMSINGKFMSSIDRPTKNFFNSTISQLSGLPVNNRNPNSINNLGFDTGILSVPNPSNSVIANDATSATIRMQTNGDIYYSYFFGISIEIVEPTIILVKGVEDSGGNDINGQNVSLGDQLNYVIGFQNTGTDDAINMTIRDVLPKNIIFNYPSGLTLPKGVTVKSYNSTTREIIFNVDNSVVEEDDPKLEIRIKVNIVDSCELLSDACSSSINNQAYTTYEALLDPTIAISNDPSHNSLATCLLETNVTNFLVKVENCTYNNNEVLCGASTVLTAADGYDSYIWSTSPTGTPVIGTGQTLTVKNTGTYYSLNTAALTCISITEKYTVVPFGGVITNPVIPYADEVVTCPNDGKQLANIFLCGSADSQLIKSNISDGSTIEWQKLDESTCAAVSTNNCANESTSCTWNTVGTGPDFTVDTAGQYRIVLNYTGGCFNRFYFNVFKNLLNPTTSSTDIICTTPGKIVVGGVPSGYEYSIDGTNYQSTNTFSISKPGFYDVYVKQVGVNSSPCVFEINDIQVRSRNFVGSAVVTQPYCNGDKGKIKLAASDVEPQYYYSIYNGTTLVNSVGPIIASDYTFSNLNPGSYIVKISTEDGCSYSETIIISEPDILDATAALTKAITCEDGQITMYPVGGTAPYFYFVNSTTDFETTNVIDISAAGTYNINVVDSNNCSKMVVIDVTATLPPELTISKSDIVCSGNNNGKINFNVTNTNGNTLRYSIDNGSNYVNSPVFQGLSAGSYETIVEYTHSGTVCYTAPETIIISENSAITGNVNITTPYTCNTKGVITVNTVSGGVSPYTYSLNGGTPKSDNFFSNLSAGSYNITIYDTNNCSYTLPSVVLDALTPPTDLVFSTTPVTCPSNTSDLTITNTVGGSGILNYRITAPAAFATSYQTSNSFPNLTPNTYTFEVRDEKLCTYSETISIAPIPSITLGINLTKDLDCTSSPAANIAVTTTDGTAPFTYQVAINGNTYTNVTQTNQTFNYSTSIAGTYQFQVTDANGCTAESGVRTVTPATLPVITSVVQDKSILCHGDATASIIVSTDKTQGTGPFSLNILNTTTGVNYGTQTTSLTAGTYTITLTDSKSCTATETITINEPNVITFVIDSEPITCDIAGGGTTLGSITVKDVTGGVAPFTYYITNNFGDIISGNPYSATTNEDHIFDIINFGIYTINVVDANGCNLQKEEVMASPPEDLDIVVNTTAVDCASGGTAEITAISTVGSGNYEFGLLESNVAPYTTSFLPPDSSGGDIRTFTNLTPGVIYTFVVHDLGTNCYFVKSADAAINPASTLTSTVLSNNITCINEGNGSATFTIENFDTTTTSVDYRVLRAFSNEEVIGTTNLPVTYGVPSTVTTPVPGSLQIGKYYIEFTENGTGSFNGCKSASAIFVIKESSVDLSVTAEVNKNANCNPLSGIVSAIATGGTSPYLYQISTSATPPLATDTSWSTSSTFNVDTATYYVHVKDSYGCIKTSLAQVVPFDPSPTITALVSNQCTANEGNFTIAVSLGTAGLSPYTVSIDKGAFQTKTFPFNITKLASGTHTIEIKDSNGCGSLISVDVLSPIATSPVVTKLPTCNNDDGEITMTGVGGSGNYTYAINSTASSIIITNNILFGVPSGTHLITITDVSTSCTKEVSVFVPAAISLTATVTPSSEICLGAADGSISFTTAGYSGDFTYEIFNDSGLPVSGVLSANTTTNPQNFPNLAAGDYTLTITETASPFCSVTSSVFTVPAPSQALRVDVSETSNVTCDNNKGTITAEAFGGWGNYQYQLTGAATVGYSSNGTFPNLAAGNYTVNVLDAKGCIASSSITLSLPTAISGTITATPNPLACFSSTNASITVMNVLGGVGSNYSYTLNKTSSPVVKSGPQATPVFNNLAAGTYTVTISDSYNCSFTTSSVTITKPLQIVSSLVKSVSQTCLSRAQITLSTSGGTGTYEYSTTNNFTTVLGTFTSSITFEVPDGKYQYYVRDTNGCVGTISNEITIDPLPPITFDLNTQNAFINCKGDSTGVIIAKALGGLGAYTYSLQDSAGNTITTAVQNSPGVFTELPAGDYKIHVLSGVDCSETSDLITIKEPVDPLLVNATQTDVTCAGSNDGIINVVTTGGTGTVQYAITPKLNQFFDTANFTGLAPGSYQVIVQDELGCYEVLDFLIAEPTLVTLALDINSVIPEVCQGDKNGQFSVLLSGGVMPYSLVLDDQNGTYTTLGSTEIEKTFTNLEGGMHTVYLRDANGCESEWDIDFPESVLIDPSVIITYGCNNNLSTNIVVVLSGNDIIDGSDLDYSLNGQAFQSSNIFTNVPAGSTNSIQVRLTNGCIKSTDTFTIDKIEALEATLTLGTELNQLVTVVTGGSGTYTYELDGESNNTGNFYIYHSGNHTVNVTDLNGCTTMVTEYFDYIDVCIPNYFTPNGDGNQDKWGPGCTSQYKNLTVYVFDRYGRKLATLGVNDKWDGTYNGSVLPAGDYWYLLKLNDNKDNRNFKGHFNLYR